MLYFLKDILLVFCKFLSVLAVSTIKFYRRYCSICSRQRLESKKTAEPKEEALKSREGSPLLDDAKLYSVEGVSTKPRKSSKKSSTKSLKGSGQSSHNTSPFSSP